MKTHLPALYRSLVAALLSLPVLVLAAPPSNDSAANATLLQGSLVTTPAVDLSTATAAITDPMVNGASAGKTVWYKIPGKQDAIYANYWHVEVTSTTGAGALSLFLQRDPENPLTSLTHTFQPTAPVTFSQGQTVTLAFKIDYNTRNTHMLMLSGTGSVSLRFRYSLVENDYPATAKVLPESVRGSVYADNRLAAYSQDEPASGGSFYRVWYRWTPSFNGPAVVDTNFSYKNDTAVAIYQETVPGTLTLLVADSYQGHGDDARVVFTATSGSTYFIAVGTNDGDPGSFVMNYFYGNSAGEISFETPNLGNTSEAYGSTTFRVVRQYAGNLAVSCSLATVPAESTASAGSDYQAISTSVNFTNPTGGLDSAWEYTGTLNLIDDNIKEQSETVRLALSSAPITAIITGPETSKLILDDESKPLDYARLGNNAIRVSERDTWANLEVIYQQSTDQTTLFEIYQSGVANRATLGTDFTAQGTTLDAWQNRGYAVLHIKDDNVFEMDEQIVGTIKVGNMDLSFSVIIENDDPFIPLPGRLNAPLSYSHYARHVQVHADVAASGAITGKATLGSGSIPFKTTLNDKGYANVLLPVKGRPPLHLSFQATSATGDYDLRLVDSLNYSSSGVSVVLQNYQPKTNPCPEMGRYTLNSSFSDYGYATLEVSVTGAAKLAARLFDGTTATMSGFIDGDGYINTSLPIYAGRGALKFQGYLPYGNDINGSVSMQLYRPARLGDPTVMAYLSDNSSLECVRYTPVKKAVDALQSWTAGTGKATLKDGPLMSTVTKTLAVAAGISAPVDSLKLKISLQPGTGLFTGSFLPPGATKTMPFSGVLSQLGSASAYGRGHFFNGLKAGSITIGAP